MENNDLAMPSARAGHEPSPAVSAVPVTIPIADYNEILCCIRDADTAARTCPANGKRGLGDKKCPKCGAGPDRGCASISVAEFQIARSVRRIAQAIEARRAETGTGSVHESEVAKPCAQGEPA